MNVKQKYNLSDEQYTKLVRDGMLNTTLIRWHEIMNFYRTTLTNKYQNKHTMQAVNETCDKFNIKTTYFYHIKRRVSN